MIKILGEATKDDLRKYLDSIDLKDERLYRQVNSTQEFVFQFSGGTASSQVKNLRPDCFNDMMDINATSRPGASGSFPDLVAAKGGAPAKYPKMIDDILSETHGIILFQEQVMAVFHLFGFSLEETNMVRGLMKKLGKKNKKPEDLKKWAECVERLKKDAESKGLKKDEVDRLVDDLISLSAYSFNKSHAFAYTYLAMETVYLSEYFKPYFYAVNLTHEAGKKDALKAAIKSCNESGFKIVPPDVNVSGAHFTPEGKNLYFGLGEIKGVGETPLDAIIRNRPYKSVIDFICRNSTEKGVTKRVVDALLRGGAFDSLIEKDSRKFYDAVAQKFYEVKKTIKTPALLEEKWNDCMESVPKVPTTAQDYIDYEDSCLGGNFFHGMFSEMMQNKVDEFYSKGLCLRNFQEVHDHNLPNVMVPVEVVSSRPYVDKNKHEMCFMEIEDCQGSTVSIPVFASYWQFCKSRFAGDGFYFVSLYENEGGELMFGSKNRLPDDRKERMLLRFKMDKS